MEKRKNKEGKLENDQVSTDNNTWIGSIKKSNDVTNETKLYPSNEPLEIISEPAQIMERIPK